MARGSHLGGLALATVLTSAFVCGTARAEIDSPEARAGLAALESLDYGRAVELLERARGQQLTVEELGATLRGLGMAHAALGQDAAAVGVFEALLRLAPGARLDRTVSPRIRGLFEDARSRLASAAAPATEPPAVVPDPADPAVQRPAGAATAPAAPAPPPASTAPAAAGPAPTLALSATPPGAATATDKPLWRRGWFWGVVGGVAAAALAGGLTLGLLSRDGTLVISTQ